MIAFVKGTVVSVRDTKAVIEVSGIGYNVFATTRDLEQLKKGEDATLHTYLQVREDAMQLFGFLSEADLQIFQLLLNVNGIGPKAALGILSALSAADLRFAILAGDAKAIAKAPGVGNKTAQKVILELKDKMDLDDILDTGTDEKALAPSGSVEISIRDDAVQALVALGYPASDALKAVNAAANAEITSPEDLLKAALKKIAF